MNEGLATTKDLMEGKSTILGIFYYWWYREAFSRFLAYQKMLFAYLLDLFSVKICLNTLFYPWKRDKVGYEGLALKEKFEALSMNLVSRFIGALVKLFTLSTFLLACIALAATSTILTVVWLFYPLVLIFLIILAIANA